MTLQRKKVAKRARNYRPPKERLLVGLDELADFLRVSKEWYFKRPKWDPDRKTRLQRMVDSGVIFQMAHGKPPRAMWCGFPQLIKSYIMRLTQNGRRFDG